MVPKSKLQAFYEEYTTRIEDLYHLYDKTVDGEEKQRLFHELEGMVYIISMLRERFDLTTEL